MKYVAIIVKTGNGYSAHLPDLPGCIAAADTFEETSQLIREAANFHVEMMVEDGDLQYAPFAQRGGIGRAYAVFGDGLAVLLEKLNLALAG